VHCNRAELERRLEHEIHAGSVINSGVAFTATEDSARVCREVIVAVLLSVFVVPAEDAARRAGYHLQA
jgi:hypothetical protein